MGRISLEHSNHLYRQGLLVMLTDTAKRPQERTAVVEPQCVETVTPKHGLSEAIRKIHADARQATQIYLAEVVTPFGGE